MKCSNCGWQLERRLGTFIFESKVLGKVRVDDIDMNVCDRCGAQLLFPGESQKVASKVIEAEMERVGKEPANQMLGEKTTADMLGISKQALNKSKKIRAGFIMSTMIDGRRYFLRESILKFAESGDGRFLLDPISNFAVGNFVLIQLDTQPEVQGGFLLQEPDDFSDDYSETISTIGDT